MKTQQQTESGLMLKATGFLYYRKDGEQNAAPAYTDAFDAVMLLAHIEQAINNIVKGKTVQFDTYLTRLYGHRVSRNTPLGNQILSLASNDVDYLKLHFPKHQFHPYVSLFLDAMIRNNFFTAHWRGYATDATILLRVDAGNRFVEFIRDRAKSAELRKALSLFRRLPNKNLSSLRQYIDALFTVYRKLTVLRIEFSYRVEKDMGASPTATSKEVKNDVKALINYLTKKFGPGQLAGYAWNIEYALEKGHQCHLFIMLNGNVVHDPASVKQLGQHWDHVIAKGRGVHFNCDAHYYEYKRLGIGTIHAANKSMRATLFRAVSYLVANDYYFRISDPEIGRTFGRGYMPKRKTAKKKSPKKKM